MVLFFSRVIAVVWFGCASVSLFAQAPGAAALQLAIDANVASLKLADATLERASARLSALEELHMQGNAAWREVAEQRASFECAEVERRTVSRHGELLSELLQRDEQPREIVSTRGQDANVAVGSMRSAEARLAAALAGREAELEAAEIACRRVERRLLGLGELHLQKLASKEELADASGACKRAQAIVERIQGERDGAREWSWALRLQVEDDCDAECIDAKLAWKLENIPLHLLEGEEFTRALLELRGCWKETEVFGGQAIAKIKFCEGLLSRLQSIEVGMERVQREVESVRGELAFWWASERASEERRNVVRLREAWLVAVGCDEPRADLVRLVRYMAPVGRLTDLAGSDVVNQPEKWPSSPVALSKGWYVGGPWAPQIVFSQTSPADNFQAASAVPMYAEYYANGNRRRDLPPWARNWFFNGGVPWYLPGSSTNFK